MFLSDLCLIAAVLTSASASDLCKNDHHKDPCKKTSQCVPIVRPASTTHLLVNWENTFEESCEPKHIKGMKIEVVDAIQKGNIIWVPFNMKSTIVEADPCKSLNVSVKFEFTQDYRVNYGIVSRKFTKKYHRCESDGSVPKPSREVITKRYSVFSMSLKPQPPRIH